MAHTILEFENLAYPDHEKYVDSPVGFSWTTLMFLEYVSIYRRQLLLFFIISVIYYIVAVYLAKYLGTAIVQISSGAIGEKYYELVAILSILISFISMRVLVATFYNDIVIWILRRKGFKLTGIRPSKENEELKNDLEFYKEKYVL